jgi:glycerophosphoryl diester phosphodiesterase
LAELQAYDCGSLKHPRFPAQVPQPGERVPSFAEVLQWLALETDPRARSVRLNVETKLGEARPDEAPDPETFARLAVDELRRHGFLKRTTLQSFDFRTLAAARRLESAYDRCLEG